ncbi:MAG: hypothetical protein R3F31_03725 [Verrucomicrobiales bacterium]
MVTLNANTGGTSDLAFAMIGHGGENADGAHSGNHTLLTGSWGRAASTCGRRRGHRTYAQIGHGGTGSSATI